LGAFIQDWLTLSEASTYLGIHPITLRTWVDSGLVRAFRTPGGHRRFRRAELAEFLQDQTTPAESRALVPAADQTLERIRSEIGTGAVRQAAWFTQLSEAERAKHRELGQRLLGLLLQFVSREENGYAFLAEAQTLAREYGVAQARSQMKPSELAQAFLFFRRAIIQATYHPASSPGQTDRDGIRLLQKINTFMDELLVASLKAYDETRLAGVSTSSSVEYQNPRARAKSRAARGRRKRS
jgi:excisionase family DNA binding protein